MYCEIVQNYLFTHEQTDKLVSKDGLFVTLCIVMLVHIFAACLEDEITSAIFGTGCTHLYSYEYDQTMDMIVTPTSWKTRLLQY